MVFDEGAKEAFTEDTLVILAENLGQRVKTIKEF